MPLPAPTEFRPVVVPIVPGWYDSDRYEVFDQDGYFDQYGFVPILVTEEGFSEYYPGEERDYRVYRSLKQRLRYASQHGPFRRLTDEQVQLMRSLPRW